MIAVIDYDTGNIRSVANALRRMGAEFRVTSDPEIIRSAGHVILPGVGEAASAMEKLRQRHLDEVIPSLTCPVLGICIGLQLMCRHSEEGNADCLGIFPTDVVRLGSTPAGPQNATQPQPPASMPLTLKIPHVGWNTVTGPLANQPTSTPASPSASPLTTAQAVPLASPLFDGLQTGTYFYFVHSYAARPCEATIALTDYGMPFSAALAKDNFYGTQFHPEKSGAAGERLLSNFLRL